MNAILSKMALLRSQAPYIPKTVKLVWQATGMWMAAWLALLLVQGILPVAIVYMTRQVVDSLVGVVKNSGAIGGIKTWDHLFPLAVLGALLVGEQVLRTAVQWVRTVQGERIQDYMTGLIHDKALAADLGFYDSPAFYDRLHRAQMEAKSRPLMLLEGMGSLAQNSLTLAGMAVLLVSYSPWIPLLLLSGTVPVLWVALRYAVRFNDWRLRNTVEERRCYYYDGLITNREAAQELRLFDLGGHYRNAYQRLRARLRGEKIALERGHLAAEFGAGTLALLTTALAMFWMILRTISGRASVGDVVLFYQAFSQGQRLLATLLRNTGEIYQNVLFLENLFELLGTEPEVRDPLSPLPVPPLKEGIRFENVDFRYPGSDRRILQGFNLTLNAGEIAAIVGENGEGKTTLVKLLCRFYDPEKGRITADGSDLRDLRQDEWRRQITVLFQEPVRYHVTASENIAHGDHAAAPNPGEIEMAAHAAGAHDLIQRLPDGYETVLGRWFGGVELSTGEWQRVALARAFLRKARLIVLDEPTSMLDAWSEAQWFRRFRTLASGCTVLIISHRLSMTMQADVIHVMGEGRIIESGTHADLLTLGGRYREAWETSHAGST
ncbi:ABC transporter ATP-binding protein [Candidatus Deferrimicrobium sp.]|uniref:ABC transporter ATP-binding protein n=1 Tax=Candidatus Deferrimicrobium sp. TaxID=3060586 RepID=UPI00272C3DCC|nr:ABC transporter ATP-binding protein [Candidatus Deferrimicrobium sp.]